MQQVFAAYNTIDTEIHVIGQGGEVIRRDTVPAADNKMPHHTVQISRNISLYPVVHGDNTWIRGDHPQCSIRCIQRYIFPDTGARIMTIRAVIRYIAPGAIAGKDLSCGY